MRVSFNLATFAFVVLAWVQTVSAQNPCRDDITTRRVRYLPISGRLTTNATDPRADLVTFEVRLDGSLHVRQKAGEVLSDRPVLIFNHGYDQQRGEVCGVVKYFTEKGWIVFMPLRRGHALNESVRS